MNSQIPAVLLPVETTARELDSKLVLASALANNGCRVIVGHKEVIEWIGRHSDKIIWQGKDAFFVQKRTEGSKAHFADYLASRGSVAMFLQDEGGIFPSVGWGHSVLTKHRIDSVRERQLIRVCVWGERQRDLLSRHGVLSSGLAVTGCPRFDLCSPRYNWINFLGDIDTLPSSYILMCTRFTSIAHSMGMNKYFGSPSAPRPRQITDLRLSLWQRDAHDFADFIILAKEISEAYPEHQIVIRPHPSESINFYSNVFAPFERIQVTRAGTALDWIRKAEAVIHCNCTTGIEAALAGRPALNFLPNQMPRGDLDKEVAKEAGVAAHSVQDALEKLGSLLTGSIPIQVWSPHAQSILNNLKSDAIPLVVDQVLSVIRARGIAYSRVKLPASRKIRMAVRRFVKRSDSAGYVASKRGAFCREHVERVLEGCRGGKNYPLIGEFVSNFVIIDPS